MNFLDAETDDADFRGAARVAMVMAVVSGVALESHRDQGMMAENKKILEEEKMMQSIDEQWPLKLTLGDAQDLDFYGSLENPILSKQVWLQSK